MLQDLDLDGKDIGLVRNLYWDQSAAIRYQNELGNFANIRTESDKGAYYHQICLTYTVKI